MTLAATLSAPADRRFLSGARVMTAIMIFFLLIFAAVGLGLGSAAGDLQSGNRLTIQIVEANADARARQTDGVLAALEGQIGVRSAKAVPAAEMQRLLEPWLGTSALAGEIPIPALIDVELTPQGRSGLSALEADIRRVAPSARVDRHDQWLAPLRNLIDGLRWLALLVVALSAAATAASIVLATRAALDTHRDTIGILHLMGATDRQIARLFQRRIAADVMIGTVAGIAGALLALWLIGGRIEALGSELVGSASLDTSSLLVLTLLPIVAVLLAMLVARASILRSLKLIT